MLTLNPEPVFRACGLMLAAEDVIRRKPEGVAILVVEDGRAVLRLDAPHIRVDHDLGEAVGEASKPLPVPLRRCTDLLRASGGDTVTFHPRRSGVAVDVGDGKYLLTCEPPDAVSQPVPFATGPTSILPWEPFREAVEATVFAADTTSTRYALGGVYMDDEDGRVVLVATDSRRMAIAQTEIPACGLTGTLLPEHLLRVGLLVHGDEVRLTANRGAITLRSGPLTVTQQRLIEGRFPRWREIVPTQFASSVDLPCGAMRQAFDRFLATLTPAELLRSCGLDFAFAAGSLTLTGLQCEWDDEQTARDRGQASVSLPVDYAGEPRVVRFDARYVRDFLLVTNSAVLDLPSDGWAHQFRGANGYRYVLMAMERRKV